MRRRKDEEKDNMYKEQKQNGEDREGGKEKEWKNKIKSTKLKKEIKRTGK
jgi:hypothetical protein